MLSKCLTLSRSAFYPQPDLVFYPETLLRGRIPECILSIFPMIPTFHTDFFFYIICLFCFILLDYHAVPY